MRLTRLVALIVPVAAVVTAAAAPSLRKDPNGIYGMIDSAIVEPSAGTPQRLQLWGRFAVANVVGVKDGKIDYIQLGFFHPPKRGFMYYAINASDEAATRADWAALRAAAGTGRVVGWGSHIPAMDSAVATNRDTAVARIILTYNGRVRAPGEPVAAPDTFPLRMPGAAQMTPRFRGPVELGFTAPDTARSGRLAPPPE